MSDLDRGEARLMAWSSLKAQPRAVSFLPQQNAFAIATATGQLVVFSSDLNAWRRRAEAVALKE